MIVDIVKMMLKMNHWCLAHVNQQINYLIQEVDKTQTQSSSQIQALKREEDKDMTKFPLKKIGYMVFCYIVMLTITLLKGSNYSKSLVGVER